LPLRLGYAITVHKSQGKTLERAIVDMGRGAFEHGQTYVALSRVRSLEGLFLTRPITPADVSADPVVTDFIDWGNVPMVGQGRLF
jgi:ATP-dependent exoDNAse (exonuclease V) alpha subunit